MRIKDLLHEVEIRFGKDWETQPIIECDYPFAEWHLRNNKDQFYPDVSRYRIWNNNGVIYEYNIWATADIKTTPEKWVLDMHSLNDKQKKSVFIYLRFDHTPPFNQYLIMDDIGDFSFVKSIADIESGYQLLTYQQWYDLIYRPEQNKPNVGDVGLFYDDIENAVSNIKQNLISLRELLSVKNEMFFVNITQTAWKNFFSIDINKPLQQELNRFLEFAGSDYRL